MTSLYNFIITVKEDPDVVDFMYKLLGGLIYAVANAPVISLNYYPMLGELGSVSQRLAKVCGWSPTLFKIFQDASKPMANRMYDPLEIQSWLNTVKDKDMANNLRLMLNHFVKLPAGFGTPNAQLEERYG